MRGTGLFTPAERRLALLLFALAVLGLFARSLERLDPRVEAWLEAPLGADSAAVPPEVPPPVARVMTRAAPADTAPAPPASEAAPERKMLRIDPNRAGSAELERLPGIGPRLAERIVSDRRRQGPYRRPEDLLRVPGIGPATLRRIVPYLNLRP